MCFCNFNSKSVDSYYYKLNLIWAFFKMVKIKKKKRFLYVWYSITFLIVLITSTRTWRKLWLSCKCKLIVCHPWCTSCNLIKMKQNIRMKTGVCWALFSTLATASSWQIDEPFKTFLIWSIFLTFNNWPMSVYDWNFLYNLQLAIQYIQCAIFTLFFQTIFLANICF